CIEPQVSHGTSLCLWRGEVFWAATPHSFVASMYFYPPACADLPAAGRGFGGQANGYEWGG
ncbi:MAG: hypothetical protein B0D92_08215, partial [Spirochaeta sp. LUC14_002_19_P3]